MTDERRAPEAEGGGGRPDAAPDLRARPDDLALRARPQPVTRLSKKALAVAAGFGLAVVFGATMIALKPPAATGDRAGEELFNVRNKPTADGLAELPATYRDLPPQLGAPLPGDLGAAVLDAERDLGLKPPPASSVENLPFRANPVDDAERAEAIRLARLQQQALESDVFFQLAGARIGEARTETPKGASPDSLTALSPGAAGAAAVALEGDQNAQGRKIGFLEKRPDGSIYNPHTLQDPLSPYQVMAGSVIAASLVTGVNSDLPGRVIAQVTENVYDTVTGRHLLIPQGARLFGEYDSVVAFGQERALLVWRRIIFPDGSSIVVDNLPAADTQGFAGLADKVDFHTWRLLKGIALATLLGVGTELTFGEEESDLVRALRESTQDSANQVGQRITERNLNIQPTITIRPGWPLRVIVNKDLILRPYGDG